MIGSMRRLLLMDENLAVLKTVPVAHQADIATYDAGVVAELQPPLTCVLRIVAEFPAAFIMTRERFAQTDPLPSLSRFKSVVCPASRCFFDEIAIGLQLASEEMGQALDIC